MNGRFEDPCSGSKFAPDGTWLQGPATRDLDRLPVKIEAEQVWVDPSTVIEGTTYAQFMTCLERYDRPSVSCWPTD